MVCVLDEFTVLCVTAKRAGSMQLRQVAKPDGLSPVLGDVHLIHGLLLHWRTQRSKCWQILG